MTAFEPPPWARNPHIQTLLGAVVDRRGDLPLIRERMSLADGDFLDLDWLSGIPREGPILLILHGLEGSSRSPYIKRLLRACAEAGWPAVVVHFRGCSGEPNRRERSYHGGETGDLQQVVDLLTARYGPALCAVGYSLGGSVLLKWLGERGARADVVAAAAVSVPFDLASAACRLDRGLSRLYQWVLLRWLKRSLKRKGRRLGYGGLEGLGRLTSFRAFDNAVTAPRHGFADADDYYRRASCLPYLRAITVPTLLVQAEDDPFLMPGTVPDATALSPAIDLTLCPYGGHVGFISGGTPWSPYFWLNDRLRDFFAPYMEASGTGGQKDGVRREAGDR